MEQFSLPLIAIALAISTILIFRFWYRGRKPRARLPECQVLQIGVSRQFNRKHTIPANSGMGKVYKANPYRWTCTCPEARRNQPRFSRTRKGRPCVHLGEAILESGAVRDTPWEPMLRDRREAQCFYYPDEEIVIGFTPGRDWLDIYARSGTPRRQFRRHGYDLSLTKWTSAHVPENEHRILQHIRKGFGVCA